MKLYDESIRSVLSLLQEYKGESMAVDETWPDAGEQNLVLRQDMAYELGGSGLSALSGIALTSSAELVSTSGVWLYGPDLSELSKDSAYARVTLVRVAENGLGEGDAAYQAICRIEHTRYRINPEGFMMRISASRSHESVRIKKSALAHGLNFAKVGTLMLKGYFAHPEVLAAQIYYITLPDFPYDILSRHIHQAETITGTLDHIFKNLIMDCGECNLKQVCDEVEGMRELHLAQGRK